MPSLTVEYATDAERLVLEQTVSFLGQMRAVATHAPDGAVIAACERLALDSGRDLLRGAVAAAIQARVAQAEADAKKKRPASAPTALGSVG